MTDLEDLRDQPATFIDNEDLAGLRSFARAHAEHMDEDFHLAWNTGWAFVRLGSPLAAIPYLERAVDLEPKRAIGYWALGTACRGAGSVARAELAFRRALELHDTWMSRHSLAVLLLERNRGAEGERLLRAGLAQRPDSRRRLEELADFLDDLGNHKEAAQLRATANQLAPASDAGGRDL